MTSPVWREVTPRQWAATIAGKHCMVQHAPNTALYVAYCAGNYCGPRESLIAAQCLAETEATRRAP